MTNKDILKLIGSGRIRAAKEEIERSLLKKDNLDLWRLYVDVLILLGENVSARAVIRNIYNKIINIHISNLILGNLPYTKAIVLDEKKLLYVPIPKCGSSTIKDCLYYALEGKTVGEFSHKFLDPYSRIISFKSLDEEYKDYFKFSIVRNPRDRLRSYFSKNIFESKSLKYRELDIITLSPNPSYGEVLNNFFTYRNQYIDFRHHTDPLVGYLGRNPGRFNLIVDLVDINLIIEKLESLCGIKMPNIHNMESDKNNSFIFNQTDHDGETKIIKEFYTEDLNYFNNYFKGIEC